ncbi:hypothetical protein ASPACDRAFT_49732 [Aspergillus aculeatus ATCC 16872]|uniref:T6SS Phospholipase effector Tle1-like catalytic domain-containing protein n=1 Tax=Aspergillus aculeatus (strain ATCC 16872 / CBS 172.66 / WB 5094) TaxID=690307 RepID=A0A1L9X5M5_ASPA1|nr:uncharacterized protein ASPACDRAFT_49732 [Aspergillus aculeatus ATCC 16872]OJK03624.1 hypothetical protein ASPACDRAFT_49732 [Aspergillus aculeatus ATCC 16872]
MHRPLPPSPKPQPARKRLIICCDGTWQSAVDGQESIPSNVIRLCRAIDSVGIDPVDHQPWQQIVWYDSGVGTNTTAAGPLRNFVEGALGKGLEGNIVEAYHFCALNWNPGDQILCFGFSRGAYTRADAYYEFFRGRRSSFGGEEGEVDGEEEEEVSWESAAEWASTPESRQVQVVGVFDTVGNLGFPELFGHELPAWLTWTDKPEWHNVGLSPNIKNAFQALALDEHRRLFRPAMFFVPTPKTITESRSREIKYQARDATRQWLKLVRSGTASIGELQAAEKRRNAAARELLECEDSDKEPSQLTQVWFPGFHIHIGGGSSQTLKNKGNMEEMSHIVFAWMLDQIQGYVSLDRELLQLEEKTREDQRRWQSESWAQWLWRTGQGLVAAVQHPLTPSVGAPPAYRQIRQYGWATGDLPDSFDFTYRLNGSLARRPRRYFRDACTNEILGHTCEYIHPTVGFRLKHVSGYRPAGLHEGQYARLLRADGQGYEYRFRYPGAKDEEVLPEWEMARDELSWERWFVKGKEALAYMDSLLY